MLYAARKCPSCGCWAIVSRAVFCGRMTETCTHCGASRPGLPWDREARAADAKQEERFQALCERHPELRALAGPGDHARIDDEA